MLHSAELAWSALGLLPSVVVQLVSSSSWAPVLRPTPGPEDRILTGIQADQPLHRSRRTQGLSPESVELPPQRNRLNDTDSPLIHPPEEMNGGDPSEWAEHRDLRKKPAKLTYVRS